MKPTIIAIRHFLCAAAAGAAATIVTTTATTTATATVSSSATTFASVVAVEEQQHHNSSNSREEQEREQEREREREREREHRTSSGGLWIPLGGETTTTGDSNSNASFQDHQYYRGGGTEGLRNSNSHSPIRNGRPQPHSEQLLQPPPPQQRCHPDLGALSCPKQEESCQQQQVLLLLEDDTTINNIPWYCTKNNGISNEVTGVIVDDANDDDDGDDKYDEKYDKDDNKEEQEQQREVGNSKNNDNDNDDGEEQEELTGLEFIRDRRNSRRRLLLQQQQQQQQQKEEEEEEEEIRFLQLVMTDTTEEDENNPPPQGPNYNACSDLYDYNYYSTVYTPSGWDRCVCDKYQNTLPQQTFSVYINNNINYDGNDDNDDINLFLNYCFNINKYYCSDNYENNNGDSDYDKPSEYDACLCSTYENNVDNFPETVNKEANFCTNLPQRYCEFYYPDTITDNDNDNFLMDRAECLCDKFNYQSFCDIQTQLPTRSPTTRKPPTRKPTKSPTKSPTHKPTKSPTNEPTKEPTSNPTRKPTIGPSNQPTPRPTENPTENPTSNPTPSPTNKPSLVVSTPNPTSNPTAATTTNIKEVVEVEVEVETEAVFLPPVREPLRGPLLPGQEQEQQAVFIPSNPVVVDGTGSSNGSSDGVVVESSTVDYSYTLPGQEQLNRIPVLGGRPVSTTSGSSFNGGGSNVGGGNGGGSLTIAKNFETQPQYQQQQQQPRPISEQQYVPAGPGNQFQQSDYIMPNTQTRPTLLQQQQQQVQQQVRPAAVVPQSQPVIGATTATATASSNTINSTQQGGSMRNDLKSITTGITRPGTGTTMLRSSSSTSTLRSSSTTNNDTNSFASTRESQRANHDGDNNNNNNSNDDDKDDGGQRRDLRYIDPNNLIMTRRPIAANTIPNPAANDSSDVKQRPIDIVDKFMMTSPPLPTTTTTATATNDASPPDTLTSIDFGDGEKYVPIHQVQEQYQQQQQQQQQQQDEEEEEADNVFQRPMEGQQQQQLPIMPREAPVITEALPGIGENAKVVPVSEVTQLGQQQQQQQQEQYNGNYDFREKVDVESKQNEVIGQQQDDERLKQKQPPSLPIDFSMNKVGRPGFGSAFTTSTTGGP